MADLNMAKARFSEAGFARSDRYEAGTRGKGSKWASTKERAKTNWAPAMQEALSKGAYGKGLDKADAGSYDSGIRDKGVNNWPSGMQASGEKFAKGVTPFVSLWNAELPTPAGGRRSPANIKRMTENVTRFITAAGK